MSVNATMQSSIPAVSSTAEGTQRERVPVRIFDNPAQLAREVARRIAELIRERQAEGRTVVLGLLRAPPPSASIRS